MDSAISSKSFLLIVVVLSVLPWLYRPDSYTIVHARQNCKNYFELFSGVYSSFVGAAGP